MNRKLIGILALTVIMLLPGCGVKNINNNELPDAFGAELYNAEFALYSKEGDSYTYNIMFMSKVDIPLNCPIEFKYTGGKLEYNCSIEKSNEDDIDNYSLYNLKIDFENICFENEYISIDSINLNYEKDKYIELKPQKFKLSYLNCSNENNELAFTNSALVIPADMNDLPFSLEIEKNMMINEIYLTNGSLNITNRNELEALSMRKGDKDIDITFSIEDNELSKYTQFSTSVVFNYTVDGVEYVKMPPTRNVVYNPFIMYENNFEKYYNEVLLKQ